MCSGLGGSEEQKMDPIQAIKDKQETTFCQTSNYVQPQNRNLSELAGICKTLRLGSDLHTTNKQELHADNKPPWLPDVETSDPCRQSGSLLAGSQQSWSAALAQALTIAAFV